jgi:hypothetical protein
MQRIVSTHAELSCKLHVWSMYAPAPLRIFMLSLKITKRLAKKWLDAKLQTRSLWRPPLSLFPHFPHCLRCTVKSLYHSPPSHLPSHFHRSSPLLSHDTRLSLSLSLLPLFLPHNPASLFAVPSFLIICYILYQWTTNYLIPFSLLILLCSSVSLPRTAYSFAYYLPATLSNTV